MTENELKMKLIDMPGEKEIWCMDEKGISYTVFKKNLYVGKIGFMNKDERFLFCDYGRTWAFTEEGIGCAEKIRDLNYQLASVRRDLIEAKNKLKSLEQQMLNNDTVGKHGTTVYIVFVGEYSDKHVENVFLDEVEAYTFMDNWNKAHMDNKGEVRYSYEACVEEYDTPISDTEAIEKLNKQYVEIYYYPDTNEVYALPEDDDGTDEKVHLEEMTFSEHGGKQRPVFSFCMLKKMLGPVEKDVLLKIAQDRYAEYKAKVLGVN